MAAEPIGTGEPLLEYAGEILTADQATAREKHYEGVSTAAEAARFGRPVSQLRSLTLTKQKTERRIATRKRASRPQ